MCAIYILIWFILCTLSSMHACLQQQLDILIFFFSLTFFFCVVAFWQQSNISFVSDTRLRNENIYCFYCWYKYLPNFFVCESSLLSLLMLSSFFLLFQIIHCIYLCQYFIILLSFLHWICLIKNHNDNQFKYFSCCIKKHIFFSSLLLSRISFDHHSQKTPTHIHRMYQYWLRNSFIFHLLLLSRKSCTHLLAWWLWCCWCICSKFFFFS